MTKSLGLLPSCETGLRTIFEKFQHEITFVIKNYGGRTLDETLKHYGQFGEIQPVKSLFFDAVQDTVNKLLILQTEAESSVFHACLYDELYDLLAPSPEASTVQHILINAGLELSGELAVRQILCFGEHLDNYLDVLERCSIFESIKLCSLFCNSRIVLDNLLKQQTIPSLRVSRARLLGLVNAFDKKLRYGGSDAVNVFARLLALCFDIVPVTFQGLLNRGVREAPGRHFQFDNAADFNTIDEATEKEIARSKGIEEDGNSDSSSGTIKNYKQIAEKRRRTDETGKSATDFSQSKSSGRSSSSISIVTLYRSWRRAMAFIQDPASILSKMSSAQALEIVNILSGTVSLFKNTLPIESDAVLHSSPLPEISCSTWNASKDVVMHKKKRIIVSRTEAVSHSNECETKKQNSWETDVSYFSPNQFGEDLLTDIISVHQSNSLSNADSFVLSYDAQQSFAAFKESFNSEIFRRDILLRITAMIRELHTQRQTGTGDSPVSLFDLLCPQIKSAITGLSDNIYRVFKEMPSCLGRVPLLSLHNVPWFLIPSSWRPPATLSCFMGECDLQENMMGRWKKDGCNEKKPIQCLETPLESSMLNSDTVQEFSPTPISKYLKKNIANTPNGSIMEQPIAALACNVDPQQQKRRNIYMSQLLPVFSSFSKVKEINNDVAMESQDLHTHNLLGGVPVVGSKLLTPPTFSRERKEWFLPISSTQIDEGHATVQEKLRQKWTDYKDKVTSDEDPINEIEESEKVVKDSLFQWRCHRLLNLTNLQLYDYSNQDRELRVKIREASLEDLIQAAIQRETVV